MPVIKIYGITKNESLINSEKVGGAAAAIKEAVAGIKELNITESEISVFFVRDLRPDVDLKEGIVAEISGLFDRPERTAFVRDLLAEKVALAIHFNFPRSVECIVLPSFDEKSGYAAYS